MITADLVNGPSVRSRTTGVELPVVGNSVSLTVQRLAPCVLVIHRSHMTDAGWRGPTRDRSTFIVPWISSLHEF